MVVYEVDNLVKRYPGQLRPANDGLSFAINSGEIFGILGDNGAGKSTLVRQMVNLLRSSSGSIRLFGKPVDKDSIQVSLTVGYMPQEGDSLNHLTVGEALYFTAHLRGLSRPAARAERDRLLELWRLEELRDKDSAGLSGGERRLLRLAVAMAGQPPVLVLDEPTNDLDPLRRRLVWDVLRHIHREEGTTIIFITHDTLEAEKVIQRVGILHQGRLVALGRPSELKQRLGRKFRIELRFSPDKPPVIPEGIVCERRAPDHWMAHAEWPEALGLLSSLDPDGLDVRLFSPTLEDIYLHYVDDES